MDDESGFSGVTVLVADCDWMSRDVTTPGGHGIITAVDDAPKR